MSAPNCYEFIFGLSRTPCTACYTLPVNASESKSGLYMDEAEGMQLDMVKAVEDCAKGNIWQIMDTARNEAIKAFKRDLLAAIGMKAKLKRSPWRGTLGDQKNVSPVVFNNTFAGPTTLMANIRSGIMTVKRIGAAFTSTQTFNLDIYDNLSDEIVKTIEISSQGNGIKWTEVSDCNLPMSSMGVPNMQYWFLYEKAGKIPMDVKNSCGCNGQFSPLWSPSSPRYDWDGSDERYRWADFVQLVGARGNDIAERGSVWLTTPELNGIILDVQFTCNIEETICKEEFNFTSNPLAAVMAHAMRSWANAYTLDMLLTTKNLNRYTLMSEEKTRDMRNRYRKEYNERINNYLAIEIVENYLNALSDCFECKDEYGFERVGIFS